MSRIYDNWEKLVEAVLRREKDRQLALCESFSSSIFSSRPSFDSDASAGAPSLPCISFTPITPIKTIQFEELKLATQNFQPDMLLGEGRFGHVFKGWIHEHFLTAVKPGSGIAVAVKKLNKRDIYYLNRQHHPNLVKLIGYGFEEGNILLVHEFMPNGSLDNHLFTRGHQSLSWATRSKVAIGAARGLSFLHDLGIIVSHEGVKTSSILLDDEFNANLSDFDLARGSSVMNHYAAPEYTTTGRSTMESDVYSFGIVLLELLSGLRVHDHNRPMKEQNLVIWARPYLSSKRKLLQIVDTRLEEYPHDGAYKVGKLSSQCLSLDPKLRPRMSEVVDALEQLHCLNTEVKLSSLPSVGPHYHNNPKEQISPTGTDIQKAHAGSSNWHVLAPATSRNDSNATNSSASFSQILNSVSDDGYVNGEILATPNIKEYTFADLKSAARNFKPAMVLGVGGFGTVHRGWVDEKTLLPSRHGTGMMVAIKKLNHESTQGFDEWQTEVDFLGRLSHPNLVKLLGYCLEEAELLLIYEFMAKGSLENHLFSRIATIEPLTWDIRLRIAIGAAKGLAFLHSSKKQVIYRDFKASNILLDGSYNAKISDFGLAKLGPAGGNSHATGHLYVKSDVYGFGVVLLEMMTRLRALDTRRPSGQQNLVEWVKPILAHRRKLKIIMDTRMEGQYSSKAAMEAAKLTLRCLEPMPRRRPAMVEVVEALQQIAALGRSHRSPRGREPVAVSAVLPEALGKSE